MRGILDAAASAESVDAFLADPAHPTVEEHAAFARVGARSQESAGARRELAVDRTPGVLRADVGLGGEDLLAGDAGAGAHHALAETPQ